MFEVTLADRRRDAESKLRADIAVIPESEDAEAYLRAFHAFGSTLFDAEAEEALDRFATEVLYKTFMRDVLALKLIEGIMPDRGLASVRSNWSEELGKISTEKEIGSEILLECRANGTKAYAREEILASDAPHGDFENFAPPAIRLSLRFQKNALIRESLRQVFERRIHYWIGRFRMQTETSLAPGSIPSRQRMGIPSLDPQRTFPPSRHSFTGGPVDPKQRTDLYDEIGWLSRGIQVLEGPPGLPPSEAVDRLLDRATGEKSGDVNVEHALNELKKHCRAAGVYRLEIGESGKAAAFEEFDVRLEALHSRYFGQPSRAIAAVPDRDTVDSQFSEQHKAEFRELLNFGVELRALNSSDSHRDFGPWRVFCEKGDSQLGNRLEATFRATARNAAIAAGAPSRANLLDWWICKLARGRNLLSLSDLIQRSVEYCKILESNARELRPLIDELDTARGLRRDRYPCDGLVPYWLYSEPHSALRDPVEEFAYWEKHIWDGFTSSIEEIASSPRRKRRWVDENGKKHAEPNEEVRRRVRDRVDNRTEILAAWTLGLSYDLAVLQANYVIDRGFQAEDAMRTFERESTELVEKVRLSWRTSAKRLGLSWRKQENKGIDFGKPFRDVSADFRHLAFSALLVGYQSPDLPANGLVVQDPDHNPLVGPSSPGESIDADLDRGGAPRDSELSLSGQLKATQFSDPKLRKMYDAVVRYQWYKKELQTLRVASKKYQTPDLLKEQFPEFEIWAVIDQNDARDVVDGAFWPGRFSWSLIKRLNGLEGKDDRTLKNYRRALKAAGISV